MEKDEGDKDEEERDFGEMYGGRGCSSYALFLQKIRER